MNLSKYLIFLLLLGLFSGVAVAERCKPGVFSNNAMISGEHLGIETPDGKGILVVATSLPRSEKREQALQIIDESSDYGDVIVQLQQLYMRELKTSSEVGSTAFFLADMIGSKGFTSVIVGVPNDVLQEQLQLAGLLNVLDNEYRRAIAPNFDESVTELALVMVGAAAFLRATEPRLFTGVVLEGIKRELVRDPLPKPKARSRESVAPVPPAPTQTQTSTTPAPEPRPGDGRADRKYQELLRKFARNRRTRQQFIQIAQSVKSGSYGRRASSEQIKKRALARIWRQAHGPVAEWIDLELAEQRGGRVNDTSAAVPKRPSRSGSRPQRARSVASEPVVTPEAWEDIAPLPGRPRPLSFAEQIIRRKDKALILVPIENFAKLKREIKDLCRQ